MNPKVVILLPAYKETFLSQTLRSLLAQTYDNFNIIVVDDASPDDIHHLVNAMNSSKIEYYRNREKEVAFLVAEGFLNSDIARKLGVSSKTVRNYKVHIRQKLQLNTPAEISLFMQKIRSILKD